MGARVLVIDDSATIRKLVSAILARNGYVPIVATDGRSGLEKLRGSEIDLVLLDYSIPRMSVRQLRAAMRKDPKLCDIPVLLMSAKEEHCEKLVQSGDVTSAIAKPFDPRSLIEAVESALAEEISAELAEDDSVEQSEARKRSTIEPSALVVKELSRALARIVAAPLAELSDRVRADLQVVEAVLTRVLGPSQIESIAAALGQSPPKDRAALSGDISAIALGEILQVLHFQRQTGHLSVTNGEAEVVVYLREGCIDLVQGSGMDEKLRLGRYLIEEGLVTREELESLLRDRSEPKLLGDMLVELGVIGDDDLHKALTRQSSELIYELLRWSSGRFTFNHRAFPNEARAARLGLPVASVVMEGFRRIDEWQLMEESFDFDEVLLRDDEALGALDPSKLNRREKLVLEAIDGKSTAREIAARLEVSAFDTFKILYELLRSRLVRRAA